MVKVYPFSCFDIVSGTQKLSSQLAPRSLVERVGGVIEGSPTEVEASRLDGNRMIARDQLQAT